MKLLLKSWLMLVLLVVFNSVFAQTPDIWQNTSSFAGGFNWGSTWWQPGTNHEYRYAETFVWLNFTTNPQEANHLNMQLTYSQVGQTATVRIWISTTRLLPVDNQNDPHWHHSWWNYNQRDPGGEDLGILTVHHTGSWISLDVSSWLAANPSNTYYITFYISTGEGNDVSCNAVWLGPEWPIPPGAIEPGPIIPEEHSPINYPNPFNPETIIKFYNNKLEPVSIVIYNVAGQKVRTLANEELMSIGEYELKWDGKNETGESLPSGTYFYKIITPTMTSGSKMTLIR
jgi:hypothetical protein